MSKKKSVKPPRIVEQEHGRYLIKAGVLHDTFLARAFPKPPSMFRHLVAEASGASIDEAIDRLKGKLDGLRAQRRSKRRVDAALPSGVPTSEEYADALRSVSPAVRMLHVLHDHALSRRRGLLLTELVKVGEFSSQQDLLQAYAKLGQRIASEIEPDEEPHSGLPFVVVLSDENERLTDKIAILQPELQDAVLHLLGENRMTG